MEVLDGKMYIAKEGRGVGRTREERPGIRQQRISVKRIIKFLYTMHVEGYLIARALVDRVYVLDHLYLTTRPVDAVEGLVTICSVVAPVPVLWVVDLVCVLVAHVHRIDGAAEGVKRGRDGGGAVAHAGKGGRGGGGGSG